MAKEFVMRPKGFWRRLITPRRVFVLGLLMLIGLGIFTYYYLEFSTMMDAKLRGQVFVRASGIYAAPFKLIVGSSLKKSDIINRLDRLGYLTLDKQGDSHRGKYVLKGNILDITSSLDTNYNRELFPDVKLKFDGERLQSITDNSTKKNLTECLLEPELLTSINKNNEKRKIIEYKDLPQDLIHAITAIEDRRFFDHSGIDIQGLVRAVYHNFTQPDSTKQGGSTITQQLVKNFFLTSERTLKRKVSEAFIAILLETRMTKQEIFQMYCNEIYLGQDGNYSINGVGEASHFYFNKDVINLTLPECALLAALIRGPGYYSPFQHMERTMERRNKVLNDMLELKFISPEQYQTAKTIIAKVRPKSSSSNADAPYFLDFLQTKLNEELSEEEISTQSMRVYSTVDMELQRIADKAFRDGLIQIEKNYKRISSGSLQGALIALNPKTGEILAMVGGRDYGTSQLNRAVDAHRQPGSVFKPIVYTAAINSGSEEAWNENIITPSTQFLDSKESFYYGNGQVYEPDNFGESYSNEMVTLRTGLTKSLNVVAVRVAEKVGYTKVARMAVNLGLPKPQSYPSIALGVTEATPLEIARAYTTFPNGGSWTEPLALSQIVDSSGNTVKTFSPQTKKAISPQVACIMTNLLRGPIDRGTAARARSLGFTSLAAGKTGTSRDGWFAGFTPNLVCVVYVGFDNNDQLGVTGGESALPIWTEFMKQAIALRPDLGGNAFLEPVNIQKIQIDLKSGLLASEECSESIEEFFLPGTAPTQPCNLPSSIPQDASSLPPTIQDTPETNEEDDQ